MKKLIFVIIVIVLTFTAIIAFAQSAKEAVMALKKLQARCETGISYREYSPALGEAKYAVNLFAESEEAKESPKLKDSILNAITHYEFANIVWKHKFSSRSLTYSIDADSNAGRAIEELYPRAPTSSVFGHKFYKIDELLLVCWAEAAKELENTTKLLAVEQKGQGQKNRDERQYSSACESTCIKTFHDNELADDCIKYNCKKEENSSNDIDVLKKENEQLKAETEMEKLKAENANLKKKLELMKSKKK